MEVVEVEKQKLDKVNSFYPFEDEIHQLMHDFYCHSSVHDISQDTMREILKLSQDILNAKSEDKIADNELESCSCNVQSSTRINRSTYNRRITR